MRKRKRGGSNINCGCFLKFMHATISLMKSRAKHEEILVRIREMVAPLNPPVYAFEESIKKSHFRTLISVLLSARTKDEVTKPASERLFEKKDDPGHILSLGEERVAELIYPVGFYKQKAKNIIKIAEYLSEHDFPKTYEDLCKFPGIGPKSANLVLSLAFGIPSVAVDIHVYRISRRLGWAHADKPEAVGEELKSLFRKEIWNSLNQVLVGFGQTLCRPVKPLCMQCIIRDECLFFRKKQSV